MNREVSEAAVRTLAGLLEARTGQQLASARRWLIGTALYPLAAERGIASLDDLAQRVLAGRDARLTEQVVEALLNHETSFFRDARAFDQLAGPGLMRLREARGEARRLRIWSAGCSTGQEAYTLAMTIAARPDLWAGWHVEILATDVSAGIVARARNGDYSHFEIQRGLPVAHMIGHFEQQGDRWRATAALRAMVRFQVHNLLDPPPPGRFDVVLCRNVLLYFSSDVRRLAFARIAAAIAPDGLLMLGAGETTIGQTDRFVSDYGCRSFYRPVIDLPVARRA